MLRHIWRVISVGWTLCTFRNFRIYWDLYSKKWYAARVFLDSEVCADPNVRVQLREFDKCDEAERAIGISPFQSALFAVGEDMHLCGHGRCEILYVDVTDRLHYILGCTTVLSLIFLLKCLRETRREYVLAQQSSWQLPVGKLKTT